jgi:hypothetical protein
MVMNHDTLLLVVVAKLLDSYFISFHGAERSVFGGVFHPIAFESEEDPKRFEIQKKGNVPITRKLCVSWECVRSIRRSPVCIEETGLQCVVHASQPL